MELSKGKPSSPSMRTVPQKSGHQGQQRAVKTVNRTQKRDEQGHWCPSTVAQVYVHISGSTPRAGREQSCERNCSHGDCLQLARSRGEFSLTVPGRQSNKSAINALSLEREGVQRKLGYPESGDGLFLFRRFSLTHSPATLSPGAGRGCRAWRESYAVNSEMASADF